MSKALFGAVVPQHDLRLVDDNRRLRRRVGELETEIAQLRALNEALVGRIAARDDLLDIAPDVEPALT